MSTRKKLLLSALGFVAATTALALWQQAAPPNIEQVAHRIHALENCAKEIYWLSSDELLFEKNGVMIVMHSPPEHAQILNLKTGQLRSLPVSPNPRSYGFTFTDEQPYRENPLPSPDGKWLLYEEGIYAEGPNRRTGWLLVRSDGSEQRKLSAPITEKEHYGEKTFWLPDSKGWYVQSRYQPPHGREQYLLERYDLFGKKLYQQRIARIPDSITADGLLVCGTFMDDPLLCRPDAYDTCERLLDRFEYPELSKTESELWSYDNKQHLLVLRVKNKQLPDQDFWAVLFNHQFPEEHREFWLVSQDGEQSRCLATDKVSNIPDGDHPWEVLSWSLDGKRVLLSQQSGHSMTRQVYAIDH